MMMPQWEQWRAHVVARTDPGTEAQIPEVYGDYIYFGKDSEYPLEAGASRKSRYTVFCRYEAAVVRGKDLTPAELEEATQVVLDM